jgi:hypothetical protein
MNSLKTKILGLTTQGSERKIIITHVTIRQSIFFLVMKLITLEALAALGVIVFHALLFSASVRTNINGELILFNVPLFVILVIAKTSLMIFIIIQWLDEYYEITTKEVIHRKGLIFKKEERHKLDHLGLLKIEQGLLGRIFNYGTLRLYNWALDKDVFLYLIHNPKKHHHILQSLLPTADEEKEIFREHLIEPEEEK